MRICPRASRRGRPLLAAFLLLLALASGAPSGFASASSPPITVSHAVQAPEWLLLDGSEPAAQLYAPTSGALFARTASGLKRSDDGGAAWCPVELPPRTPSQRRIVVAIDPTDHTRLFANGEQGLYRSTDDAQSWTPLPLPSGTGLSIRHAAVSQADRAVVYASKSTDESVGTRLWLVRSTDGGDTWELASIKESGPSCGFSVTIFWPHPTDAARIVRQANCFRGEPNGAPLEYSSDQGTTWSFMTTSDLGVPIEIVGAQGALPGRSYMTANQPQGLRGAGGPLAHAYRRDDDAGEWTRVFSTPGGQMIPALAYDPQRPDRAYIGLSDGTILATTDAGAQWSPLTSETIGAVNDLAVGIDGANLYAATEQGVWRFSLDLAPAGQ